MKKKILAVVFLWCGACLFSADLSYVLTSGPSGGARGNIGFAAASVYFKERNKTWGLSLSPSIKKNVEFSVKAGKMSPEGFITFLNNPSLSSTVSPFSSADRTFSSLGASLPSLSSSFNTDFSCLAGVSGNFEKINLKSCFMYVPKKEEFLGSMMAGGRPGGILGEKTRLYLSLYGSNNALVKKKTTSWYESTPFYHDGRISSCGISLRADFGVPSFTFHGFVFQNPYGEFSGAVRGGISVLSGGFSFVGESFLNPGNQIFTASSKILNGQFQIKGSLSNEFAPWKKKGIKDVFFTPGAGGFWSRSLVYTEDTVKATVGLKINIKKMSCSFTAKNDWKTYEKKYIGGTLYSLEPEVLTLGAVLDLRFKYFSLGMTGSFDRKWESDKGNWKTGISMEGGIRQIKTLIKADAEFTKEKLKNFDVKFQLSGTL